MKHHKMKIASSLTLGITAFAIGACSTLVNESHVPINLYFTDGSAGTCTLRNKRETYNTAIPATISARRSDDALVYNCKTDDGRSANGKINSQIGQTMAGNIIFGGGIGAIIDANNDMHREYPGHFAIPVVGK